MEQSLIAILGPTAVGKTALSIKLAEEFRGEIVSVDSRQVYRGMDIGTAKPTADEQRRVRHHLLDIVNPDESFTLSEYQYLAYTAIADIHARGRVPFLVGGSGLYVRAVLDGLVIPRVAPNHARRAELAREDAAALYARLQQLDPAAAAKIAQAYPQGVHYEEYAAFANQIGADIVLVPNLETSSVDEQVAWFKQLASEKILTRYIELGNEFWVAMAGDPNVERKWQSEPAAMNVMRQYEQALRPIVGAGAKFAVQASAASFTQLTTNSAFAQRLVQWDRDLAPADWFDAVTAHLYPSPDLIAAQAGNPSLQEFFGLMMGREDAGIDRVLNDIANPMPGKEIWVTEWNPQGGSPVNINTPAKSKVQPPMNAQLIARTLLAMLRHPQVTQSLYFTLNVSEGTELQSYAQSGDQFLPMAPTVVVGWFDDAANGGATFQRVVEANGQVVSNLGPLNESYRPIEGGWFQSDRRTVLILQNASAQARAYDPTQANKPKPIRVDLLATPDLENTARVPASVASLDPASPIVLPAYSIARVVWE